MSRRILDETDDILHLYRHHVGRSEIPIDYHVWACIAAIAACVADRVFYMSRGEAVNPSLYTMMLGPSSIGKDVAMRTMRRYLRPIEPVRLFSGMVTAQRLVHLLSAPKVKREGKEYGKLFLVNPELAMTLDPGPPTLNFVRHVTGMWQEEEIDKSTITDGDITVRDACLNWLFGTTIDWFVTSIPRSAILGGFLGRIAVVNAKYNLSERIPDAVFPSDVEEVSKFLRRRFRKLTELRGEFVMTKQGRDVYEQWYHSRPPPNDERMIPTWKRLPLLVLKLSQIVSLSEWFDMKMQSRHVMIARDLGEQSYAASETVVNAVYVTRDTEDIAIVRGYLERVGAVKHTALMRFAMARGVDTMKLRACIQNLREAKMIRVYTSNTGGRVYEWKRRRIPIVL